MSAFLFHILAFLLTQAGNSASTSDILAMIQAEGAPAATDAEVVAIVQQLESLGLVTYDAPNGMVAGISDGTGSVIVSDPSVSPGITTILRALEAAVNNGGTDELQDFRDAYMAAGFGAGDLHNAVALARGVALIAARKLNDGTARDEMMRAARACEFMMGAV